MISEKERGISMSRSRHTEAQMIAALKQVEAGRAVEDVAREKHKYDGMDVSQAQEAKQLRDENTRLRKLVADSESGQGSIAVGDPKKRVELVALKAAIGQMKQEYAFSERRACGVVMVAVSTYRYETRRSEVKRHLVCKRWTIEKADENSNGIPWFVLHRPNSDKLRFHLPSLPWHWFDA